jgi:hypothetical protein
MLRVFWLLLLVKHPQQMETEIMPKSYIYSYQNGTEFPANFAGSIVLFKYIGFFSHECQCKVCQNNPIDYKWETVLIY